MPKITIVVPKEDSARLFDAIGQHVSKPLKAALKLPGMILHDVHTIIAVEVQDGTEHDHLTVEYTEEKPKIGAWPVPWLPESVTDRLVGVTNAALLLSYEHMLRRVPPDYQLMLPPQPYAEGETSAEECISCLSNIYKQLANPREPEQKRDPFTELKTLLGRHPEILQRVQ